MMRKEEEYKARVKANARAASFKDPMELKSNQSIMVSINCSVFNPLFDYESTTTISPLRTRTFRGVKNDFRGMYMDTRCPLVCKDTDIISHVLQPSAKNVAKDKAKY